MRVFRPPTPYAVNHESGGLTINFIEVLARFCSVARMRKQDETELPALNTRRWTIRRKIAVLQGLRSGALTLEHARERYALSVEEIRAWERDLERHGVYGLRATLVQVYRRSCLDKRDWR